MFNGKTYYGEQGYLALLKDVLEKGVSIPDRTSVGSQALFDAKVVYGPEEFPFSTVRPAPTWMSFEEFWMFMRGETQTKQLEAKGINFWKGNTSREFLDKRGLHHLEEGDMGMAYGHQLCGFNKGLVKPEYAVNQLAETFETLKLDPYSRRIYTTLWNPSASKYMALTPCWHSHQFVVLPDEDGQNVLNLKLFNRSLDSCFGYSFAVQQYRIYQMSLAKALGYKLGYMVADLTQVHIYDNQVKYVEEILERELGVQGTLTINKNLSSLDDIISLKWEDIQVQGLLVNDKPFVTPRPPMAV